MKICTVKYCDKTHKAKGFCNNHYAIYKRGKNPHNYFKHTSVSLDTDGKKMSNKSYHQMKQRCLNPNNPRYSDYGGRGITICDSWIDSFDNFYKDMGDRPLEKSLDRINNDRGYSPQNCKWSTDEEQVYNRRNQHNNTSGYVGISYDKRYGGRWVSRVNEKRKRIFLGSFKNKEEAIKAREKYVNNK